MTPLFGGAQLLLDSFIYFLKTVVLVIRNKAAHCSGLLWYSEARPLQWRGRSGGCKKRGWTKVCIV